MKNTGIQLGIEPGTFQLLVGRMLLPLSHWTHGRGTEANLLITARLEASANSSCLSVNILTVLLSHISYCHFHSNSGIHDKVLFLNFWTGSFNVIHSYTNHKVLYTVSQLPTLIKLALM